MEELSIREMNPVERMYSYAQSRQIMGQSGCIGRLRGEFSNGFQTTWDDHDRKLNTEAFKNEFDDVIRALREEKQYGQMLSSREALGKWCGKHKFQDDVEREFLRPDRSDKKWQ